MRRIPVGLIVAATACLALVVGGTVMMIMAVPGETASFGWFAYQPTAGMTVRPDALIILTPLTGAGIALVILGLVLLGGIVGFLLGRRRGAHHPGYAAPP
ncbi:hypothetical protein [Microbacterium sp.]|uniref:hypothetical protein n=1 Tax=Microbacterium sp. TaxID=51671 RepID=UPI003A8C8595